MPSTQLPGQTDSPDASPYLRRKRWHWIVLVACLVVQFLAARQTYLRDIEGSYPFHSDQGVYLAHVYQAFEVSRSSGLLAGISNAWFQAGRPQGVLLQGEAMLASTLFGASRTTCLLVVFCHFALLQVCVFLALRKISGRAEFGFLGIGLLLLTSSRYFYAGGLDDFRLDLPAASLYGVAICALIASDIFADRKWSFAFVLFSGALFATRFISATYTLIATACLLPLVIAAQRLEWLPSGEGRTQRIIVGSILSPLLMLPFVWSNLPALYQYYFVGHLAGPDAQVRAQEQGVFDQASALLFYPNSLLWSHLGTAFLTCALLLLAIYFFSAVFSRTKGSEGGKQCLKKNALRIVAVLLFLIAPLVLFSFDQAKSPVVACMLVPSSVLLVMLALQHIRLTGWKDSLSGSFLRWEAVLSIAVLVTGLTYTVSHQTHRRMDLPDTRTAKDLYRAYDELAKWVTPLAGREVLFTSDRLLDYFNGSTLQVVLYERTGMLISTRELIATQILAIPKEAALTGIDQSDFALVTLSHTSAEKGSRLPFDTAMVGYKGDLLQRAQQQMIPIAKVQFQDHSFQIFARPQIVFKGDSAGWLTSEGAGLRIPGSALRQWKHVVFGGSTILADQLKNGLHCESFTSVPDEDERRLPCLAYLAGDRYFVGVDFSGLNNFEANFLDIQIRFPTYFVPSERGINPDQRKLVVRTPTSTRLLKRRDDYPKELTAPTTPERKSLQ